MGKARCHERVKLTVGVITSRQSQFPRVYEELVEQLGEADYESVWVPFHFTQYYNLEMGEELWRKLLSFRRLVRPQDIVSIKLATNEIEQHFAWGLLHRRCVNIDPGYLTLAKLVLATTKDFSHRVYLDRGIYVEVTLRYVRGKGFQPWQWTYPDYQTDSYRTFFEAVRRIYKRQLTEHTGAANGSG